VATAPPKRRFYDLTPSPSSMKALWDKIYDLFDNLETAQATINRQEAALLDQGNQIDVMGEQTRQALIAAGKMTGVGTVNEGTDGGEEEDNCDELANTHDDHIATVEAVIADLVAHGVDLSGECGSWTVVNEVVKWLRPSEPTIGLIAKGGTNCNGYSIDALMYNDGVVFDILINAENAPPTGADPQWGYGGCRDPSDWRDPV